MIPHILLVENDLETLAVLIETVKSIGFTFDTASDAETVINMIQKTRYQILVTALDLPLVTGDKLINLVLYENSQILCILISPVTDIPRLIPFLNEHKAYFFVVKPIAPDLLRDRLVKAFEVWEMRSKLQYLERNEQSYYQQTLDIFDWKKAIQSKKFESFGSKIIRQLNIALFHGGGIGGILTILSLVFAKAKKNPDSGKYEISENQFQMLRENYDVSRNLINGFSKAQAILMDNSIYTDKIVGSFLIKFFDNLKNKLSSALRIKNQRLIISSLSKILYHKTLIFNVTIMESVLSELLINAMKYSEDSDVIYIIFFSGTSTLDIKIVNPAYTNADGSIGITGDNELLLFEPFHRLSAVSIEGYTMEEFGAGIGLTVVKKVIDRHNASIDIITIMNHDGKKSKMDVSVTLRFPFID